MEQTYNESCSATETHGEKWRSGEYERLLRIKNDYYKREESI